jgi:hypothetical protein
MGMLLSVGDAEVVGISDSLGMDGSTVDCEFPVLINSKLSSLS